jgi:membrane protein YdbS with pleckstrin-like domain
VTQAPRDGAKRAGDGAVKTPDEARQAVKTFHVRWVLVISLVLAVIAVGGAWLWYVSAQPDRASGAPEAVATHRS